MTSCIGLGARRRVSARLECGLSMDEGAAMELFQGQHRLMLEVQVDSGWGLK